jgi:hypothetical protein
MDSRTLNNTNMSNTKLTDQAKEMLIGRRIYEVGDTYITLDNGHRIYLTDEEIESLNPYEDENN